MIDLEKEYTLAEKEYDLVAFDCDPNVVYELTVCHSSPTKESVEEDMYCVCQTIGEIKEEIGRLVKRAYLDMEGLMVIAFEIDDSSPVPAYLILRKDFSKK